MLELQASDARFINASVEFDLATLKPTYRLLWGAGGLSNALAVAEGLGFDPLVVQRARDIVMRRQVNHAYLASTVPLVFACTRHYILCLIPSAGASGHFQNVQSVLKDCICCYGPVLMFQSLVKSLLK